MITVNKQYKIYLRHNIAASVVLCAVLVVYILVSWISYIDVCEKTTFIETWKEGSVTMQTFGSVDIDVSSQRDCADPSMCPTKCSVDFDNSPIQSLQFLKPENFKLLATITFVGCQKRTYSHAGTTRYSVCDVSGVQQ